MSKFTFSNDGFQAMQKELYQSSDATLLRASTAVASNFNSWLAQNFELSPTQIDFIESLSPQMTAVLAAQTSFFMANRLPITLVKQDNHSGQQMQGSKLIRSKSKTSASSKGEDGFDIDAELKIEISY